MSSLTVLISGANRGLGKGILERYLARPNVTVIAANRDPHHPSSQALNDLPKGEGSKLIIVKVDATIQSDPLDAIKQLVTQEGVDHLDVVVANAGVSLCHPKVSELTLAEVEAHFKPNVIGLIWLYQATLPALLKSVSPKWVYMGSSAGAIETYGHWLTKRINGEEDTLTAYVVDPGFVATDLGNRAANALGLDRAPLDSDVACDGVIKTIDEATKETHGGKFISFEGKQLPW